MTLWRGLLIAFMFGILMAVLALLYDRSQTANLHAWDQIAADLKELKQLDAEWNLTILKSHIGINNNAGDLSSPLPAIHALETRLENALRGIGGNARSENRQRNNQQAEMQQVKAIFSEKIKFLEQYKLQNAALQNSLRYLPGATVEFRKLLAATTTPRRAKSLDWLDAEVSGLLSDLLGYGLLPDPVLEKKIAVAIGSLDAARGSVPVPLLEPIALLTKHARVILNQRSAEDAQMLRIVAAPTVTGIDALSSVFDQNFQHAASIRQRYRAFLFGYSALLLTLLAYAVWRLGKSYAVIREVNKQVSIVNETLEVRVAERTRELQAIQDQLRASDARYRMMTAGTNDVIWIIDIATNRFTYVSPSVERQRGYTAEEVMAQPVAAQLTDESARKLEERRAERIRRFMAGDESQRQLVMELDMKRKDGGTIRLEVVSNLITDEHGVPMANVGISRDITERRKRDEELKDSQEKLQAIVDTALDGVVRMDAGGNIVGWNSQAEKIFGWSHAEVVGRKLHQTIIPEQYREAHLRGMKHFMASGSGAVLDTRIEVFGLHRSGREFPIELAITQVRTVDKSKYEFCSFIRDITERREREESLRAANVRAEAASKAKGAFLANMSHEIRTPMNAIIGMAHLALRSELSAKQRDYIEKIHGAGVSLLGIINDILDFSKIEAGKLDMEKVEFSLTGVFNDVSTVTLGKAQEKGLEYLLQIPLDLPLYLIGDPLRLGQVLINLINNAVKFTEQGEIAIGCRQLGSSGDLIELEFVVCDTGIGMSREQAAKLFQAFSQADESTTRKYGGTGLGLSICKRLVELMGGTIWLDSAEKNGTRIHFTAWFGLSRKQEGQHVVPEQINGMRMLATDDHVNTAGYGNSVLPRFENLTVLLVEDNEVNQQIATELMESAGIAVQVAGNGSIAVERLLADGAAHYGLVFMDVQMPEMDGHEATRRIRADARFSALPIIAMTAHAMLEEHQRCLASGMNDHLAKPVNPAELYRIISRWCPDYLQAGGTETAREEPDPVVREPVNREAAQALITRFAGLLRDCDGEAIDLLAEEHVLMNAALGTGAHQRIVRAAQQFDFDGALAALGYGARAAQYEI